MENPLADLLNGLDKITIKRLPFNEQCSFYAALKLQVPSEAISKAAGVSTGTVSYLGHAGEVRGGQLRYPAVAREYESLGHEAFVKKYMTDAIRDRLAVAIDAYRRKIRNPDINDKGYNPRADGYVGHCILKPRGEYATMAWEADIALFTAGERPGYFYRVGKPYPQTKWCGNPERDDGGFVTSTEAYRFVRDYLTPKD